MKKYALQAALRFLDSWLEYRMRQLDYPGLSVAIYHDDSVVFARGYGWADIERRRVMTSDHVFGVASQSKMFTAAAVLQLAEAGRLKLDDRAADYVPWFGRHNDRQARTITIRQLLSHSAGLFRDSADSSFWLFERPFPDARELRESLLGRELACTPNTRLKYSNLGIALLGPIIEAASGETFTDYIQRHIIVPLELTSTFADYTPGRVRHLATAYGQPYDKKRLPIMPRRSAGTLVPAVGVYTTASDMCRFVAGHFYGDRRLISDEMKREAQRVQWTVQSGYDYGKTYGLGLEIQHVGERRLVGHDGHLAGYLTATFFDPAERLAVSVLGNSRDMPAVPIMRGVFEALDWFAAAPGYPGVDRLRRFSGRYCNPTGSVEIVVAGNRIAAIEPDDWEPFTWHETLECVDENTLRFTTPGSIFNEHELVHYTFEKGTPRSVNFAGIPLVPEAAYRERQTRS